METNSGPRVSRFETVIHDRIVELHQLAPNEGVEDTSATERIRQARLVQLQKIKDHLDSLGAPFDIDQRMVDFLQNEMTNLNALLDELQVNGPNLSLNDRDLMGRTCLALLSDATALLEEYVNPRTS